MQLNISLALYLSSDLDCGISSYCQKRSPNVERLSDRTFLTKFRMIRIRIVQGVKNARFYYCSVSDLVVSMQLFSKGGFIMLNIWLQAFQDPIQDLTTSFQEFANTGLAEDLRALNLFCPNQELSRVEFQAKDFLTLARPKAFRH